MLSAVMNQMGVDTASLTLYRKGLVALGALTPKRQAIPIPKSTVYGLVASLRRTNRKAYYALILAWKTASRLGEIVTLTRDQLVFLPALKHIIVIWRQATKGTRMNPWAEYMFTVIAGTFVEELMELRQAPLGRLFPGMTVSSLSQILPDPYTAHSVKRGAAQVLVDAVSAGKLTAEVLQRVLKHRSENGSISSVTLRYIAGNVVSTALMLGTQNATILL